MSPRPMLALGLFAAIVAAAGCDAPDAEGALPRDDADADAQADLVGDPNVCDLVARPSVYFVPVRRYDDFQMNVQVDAVWYEYEGETYEATCLPDERDGCRAWIAGWERAGKILVSAEYCDTVVDVEVEVPIDEDGCHVETQFLLQPMSTRGCLATAPTPTPPPGPLPL